MKTLGNIIWFLVVGLVTSISWFLLGIAWCVTLIGIPFGIQAFKFAKLAILPFGKTVSTNFGSHPIMNVLWFILGGFTMVLSFFFSGVVLCITLIGIPFAKQCFKLARLSLAPFGATVD
ncbi:MAG: YccF domain-containing protein [Clostridia bacterium]|nr:YccF domain-containing protein [Clostridia bacterium]